MKNGKIGLSVVLLATCWGAGCSVHRQADVGQDGSSVASVDMTLPEKSTLDKKLADALTDYSLSIKGSGVAGCESSNIDNSGAYASVVKLQAKLLKKCQYSYRLLLGSKDLVSQGKGYYIGEGAISPSDMVGKDKLSLDIQLNATAEAQALGLPGSVQTGSEDIDVSVTVKLPAGSSTNPSDNTNPQPSGSDLKVELVVDGSGVENAPDYTFTTATIEAGNAEMNITATGNKPSGGFKVAYGLSPIDTMSLVRTSAQGNTRGFSLTWRTGNTPAKGDYVLTVFARDVEACKKALGEAAPRCQMSGKDLANDAYDSSFDTGKEVFKIHVK